MECIFLGEAMDNRKIFIVGGAGFIGSHVTKHLLHRYPASSITIYDNFSSGKCQLDKASTNNPRLAILEQDAKDLAALTHAMQHHDIVFHFASNPDIAKAVTTPDIDFWEGTYLTQNVLEAMRINQVKQLIYASGSGVYGDTAHTPVHENFSPMRPISTYGASKLACESLINAYCHLFEMQAQIMLFLLRECSQIEPKALP